MKIVFPDYANICFKKIEDCGFEAWFVGGSVRDALLNRDCFDIDIATNALPEDILGMFDNAIPTGIKHGTVTVIIEGKPIEVTTYRSESGYDDSRHPDSVTFEKDIKKDLSRRDFTINALAYNPQFGILDCFDGIKDLKEKIIRAVGNPEERFFEDALRILRAFRFSSVLNFKIDEKTLKAAYNYGNTVSKLSGERVLSELKKLSCGDNPSVFQKFINLGYLKPFGINRVVKPFCNLSRLDGSIRLAALIFSTEYDFDKIASTLKPDKNLLNTIKLFESISLSPLPASKQDLKASLSCHGAEIEEQYLKVLKHFLSDFDYSKICSLYNDILSNDEPYRISHLAINGDDLAKLSFSGKEIGGALKTLLNYVICDPQLNNRNQLFEIANKIR